MLVNNITRLLVYRRSFWTIFELKKRDSSTTISSNKKLTSSYFHHESSLPFVYKTLSQSFDETAAKYLDHECLVFKGEQKRYTFKSFKDEVDSIAASLLELGFEKNDRIAVWLPNTSENVAITYAASKLGLIKVNINPAYVERELEYCLNKVGCTGLILPPSVKTIDSIGILRRLVPELDRHSSSAGPLSSKTIPTLKHVILTGKELSVPGTHSYLDLIERGSNVSREKLVERQASVNPDSPVSIFYTSGTTGQPKAATLTNFNMLNMALTYGEHLGQYFTKLCVPIPMFHIFSEIVGVLNLAVSNRKLIFPAILPDALATMRAIDEEKCTALIGAPIIYRDILRHADKKKYDLSSLVYGALGASPIQADFLRQVEKEFPIKRTAQLYGMTENSALLTSSMWAGDEDPIKRHSSLGRGLQRLEIKVADNQGLTVPIGAQGEVWARGFPIMCGYYGDPEKTSETITPSGWMKTGDQATMDEDGYLYLVGRQKEMIIRGGVNIYPIEIENVIVQHPCVAEAQVFSVPDERYGEEVCAWIRLKPNMPECEVEDITKFLIDKIAFFKIPKHMRIVDKFIMTPTGKVQKFKQSEWMANELKKLRAKH